MAISLTLATYTQNFDTLANTAGSTTNSLLPTGWVILETGGGARDNEQYAVDTGSSNTGDTYSYGAAGGTDRALGSLRSGTLIPVYGASFSNDTGQTITSLLLSYTGEQWRAGVSNGRTTPDRLDFQYSTDATSLSTGGWTDVNGLDFSSPVVSAAGPLDGNLAANRVSVSTSITGLTIPVGATIWIRWVDVDITPGSDDGLGIDDLSLTATTIAPTVPTVSISAFDPAASEAGSDVGVFRITRTGDTTGSLDVSYTVGAGAGSATNGVDYTPTLTGAVTIPAGQSFVDISITPVDDSAVEGNETVVLTVVDTAAYDLATASATVTIADNDLAAVKIHDIQGASHRSPLVGQSVANVPGIVTAVDSNGFYMQDPNPDANPATSEAILVFTNSAPTVVVGQAVTVSGTVTEFRPSNNADNLTTTEITSPVVTLGSTGNALPVTVVGTGGRAIPTQTIYTGSGNPETTGTFDPTVDGIDFWESLEGMLVRVNNPVTSSPTITASNGDLSLWVLADNGANATSRTERGGSLITASDYNPERIQIYDGLNKGPLPFVNVGAKLSDVTGVISYFSGNFELHPTTVPTVLTASPLQKEVTTLTNAGDKLTVATFNAENLDPFDPAEKIAGLAAAIVNNLKSPDIVNLEEIQDDSGPTVIGGNDGTVSVTATMKKLIDAIALAGGPTYVYRQISPIDGTNGGEPGGNIRVVFMYNPDRVEFVDRAGGTSTSNTTVVNNGGQPQLSASPGLVDPTNAAFGSSRKPLVGEFKFNGDPVFVVGNHFVSKGGDDPLFGTTQPPVLSSETTRTAQATIVKNFVQSIQAVNPAAKVIVAGDLNDFEFSNPNTILESAGLTSLIETLPADQRYSYNFQGNAQTIDHLMASASLTAALAGYDVVHVNSEFVDQVSDHDPVLARFTVAQPTFTGGPGRDTLVGSVGVSNDVLTGGQGRDVLVGGEGSDKFVFTSLIDFFDVIIDFKLKVDALDVAMLKADFPQGTFSVATINVPTAYFTQPLFTLVSFDPDGAGPEEARPMVQLVGVAASLADLGLEPPPAA